MLTEKLLPAIGSLQVDTLELCSDRILLKLRVTQSAAVCPSCHYSSRRVHSRYTRHFADVPWAGRAVYIHLCVRRFFCDHPTCERVTFTEQVPELIAPFAQRTQRLAAAQRVLGLALGGEAGARTAKWIGLGTSPDTILRLIRSTPEPDTVTPRVLGIDDWAIRKGQTYGTILVDLERSQVIDVLPDRTAETVVAWLQQHPGIEVNARDRANGYAQAVTAGAPHAAQVADRFHLLMNLRETLERFFDRHQADLRK